MNLDDVAERTRRRVTLRLMPFLILIYLTAYLDRANIAIAKLQMQGALHLTDEIIGFGAGIFFIGYFLLEIPGSLIVERWSARRWLARIMITWGLVATLSGFTGMLPVPTGVRAQFYWLRFLLGAAEAGFFPGVVVYLSHWFRLADRSRAKAWFMIAQPLSIVVGLPISRWILETVHWRGMEGWRWVFILEGAPPVILGFVTLYYLTDRPGAGPLASRRRKGLAHGRTCARTARTDSGRPRGRFRCVAATEDTAAGRILFPHRHGKSGDPVLPAVHHGQHEEHVDFVAHGGHSQPLHL